MFVGRPYKADFGYALLPRSGCSEAEVRFCDLASVGLPQGGLDLVIPGDLLHGTMRSTLPSPGVALSVTLDV